MASNEERRPDPDALLREIQGEKEHQRRGKLKIFFGMCAGVGKTYDMLKAAHVALSHGVDVVVGYVETHGRAETEALCVGLPLIPRKRIDYRGTFLEEMDLDALLARKPGLVLVDELAHSNAPGSRHTKRYKDVEELLDHGIDVYTTLNVQHLESRADTVSEITGAPVRETVPDSILERADDVEVVDLPPDELLQRLSEGKVYTAERSRQAVEHFFRKGNITALREMSLRITAERVDGQLREYMRSNRIPGPWKTGQRIIVGISSSPHSIPLIRWARRLAFTQNTSWVAVHVETSSPPSAPEREQLAKNVKLAQELGAEVLTTADEDIAEAILRVARRENCTLVLVGRTRGGLFGSGSTFLRRMIARSGELDIYVLGAEKEETPRARKLVRPSVHSGISQYAAAAALILLVGSVCYPLVGTIGYQTVALILLLTVAFLPLLLGIGPVLLAAGLSALVWDFFFIPPLYTFSIERAGDVLMFIIYFSVALVSGVLTTRARSQERAVRIREERAVALYTLSRDLSLAQSKDAVASAAVANIRRFFDAEVVICLGKTDGDIFSAPHESSTLKVDEKELAVASWVYWNEKKAGKNTDTLPSSVATYLPLSGPRYPLGVIGIKTRTRVPLSIDQETLLENFIRQIASAVERETLNEITKKAMVIEESEKLYQTLFNSISHEMRTPLSALLGAAESLLDEHLAGQEGVRSALAREIHDAAQRLERLVANLLDMTRLESGLLQPNLDWGDLRDLISTTVGKMSRELSAHPVRIDTAVDLPLVKMDFALLEQALTNLLLNASLYTPAGAEIRVRAYRDAHEVVLAVEDGGAGLPEGSEEKIFEKFYRLPGTGAGGTGLGLSIARGFIAAHRGTIRAENRAEGGARFIVRLPAEPPPLAREEETLV